MTRQQRDSEALPSGWDSYPPGEVYRLGKRLRERRARRQFLRGAAATAAGLLVTGGAFGLWWAASGSRDYDYGEITCSQVMPLLNDYLARKLPPTEQARVRDHLALCPRCRPVVEKIHSAG